MHPRRLLRHLPEGGRLPAEEWTRRHTALTRVLWVCAVLLGVYAAATGYSAVHTAEHLLGVVPLALLAGSSRLGVRARSWACAFGLLTVCALAVHTAGGVTEAHFTFFVVIVALTLYEDWTVLALAVAYTLLHHGILGMFAPQQVFHDPEQYNHPWAWAAIHAVFVAAAGVAAVVAWHFNEEVRRSMRAVQHELRAQASTDSLTGLSNRRQLLEDLEKAIEVPGMMLALFDLDGFKGYNDSFGHQAGDVLLARLGRRLAKAVEGVGTAYRLGGDEFCVLIDPDAPARTLADAQRGLEDSGEAFTVTASYGDVSLDDVATAGDAMVLADRRMYAAKGGGRSSASRQSADVLLRALAERDPRLAQHVSGVAGSAIAVARSLGLDDLTCGMVGQSAELHDIGKVAIPEAILGKPGPLDEGEWDFMRRHTLIGERILAAAPALVGVAKVVRSTHERWDGGGYPDGLDGEEIPLGSRIVAVCDAFDAMIADRPYRAALSGEAAAAELHRCAGSQFDPAIVAAFLPLLDGAAIPPPGDHGEQLTTA